MNLGRFGSLDWGNWLYGLVAAFIGGGASAFSGGLSAMLNDSKDYNMNDPTKLLHLMATTFVISGIIAMMTFLHRMPVPERIVETTVEKKEEHHDPPMTITTTRKEIVVEPVEPPKP